MMATANCHSYKTSLPIASYMRYLSSFLQGIEGETSVSRFWYVSLFDEKGFLYFLSFVSLSLHSERIIKLVYRDNLSYHTN